MNPSDEHELNGEPEQEPAFSEQPAEPLEQESAAPAVARKTLSMRLRHLSRVALLLFILASAAFLSAITTMRIAIQGREVSMPNLTGKTVAQASQMLNSQGLVLHVADQVYSEFPLNTVVRQTPPPGMLMKVSQQAHVVLSLGQRQLSIPALQGKSLRVARIELLRAGLQAGELSGLATAEAVPETILVQNPRPGEGAATPRVNLLIAQPVHEAAYVTPLLAGLSEAEAGRRLDQVAVRHKSNYVNAAQWPHGAVIDQTPAAGSRLGALQIVELVVAN
ncbi:MAG: PASTA domain-containing protein [Acidobacteriia bacterium]|nr:PASTA domain-containing protein [Terriglobia bacterium]